VPGDLQHENVVLYGRRCVGEQYQSRRCRRDAQPSSHSCQSGHGTAGSDALDEDDPARVADGESHVLAYEGGEVFQVRQRALAQPLTAWGQRRDLPQP
jgi:hypothetical protein